MSKTTKYNKLVRSRIIQEIIDNGNKPQHKELLYEKKHRDWFYKKLEEEVTELQDARSRKDILEEAADVLQVLQDFIVCEGITLHDLEDVRRAKQVVRGPFAEHVLLGHKLIVLTKVEDVDNGADG